MLGVRNLRMRLLMEDLPTLAWNGTITFATVFVGGRMLMNGIYKKLDEHGKDIKAVGERVARIEGKLDND